MSWFNNISQKVKTEISHVFLLLLVMLLSGCSEDTPCPTIHDYIADGTGKNCLLCPLFLIVTETSQQIAGKTWDIFHTDLQAVVTIAASIYIAIFTLQALGAFMKQNAAEYLTGNKKGLFQLMFKTAVIVLILGQSSSNSFLIKDIIIPIETAGLEIGGKLSTINSPAHGSGLSAASTWGSFFDLLYQYARAFNDNAYRTIAIGEAMACNGSRGFIIHWEFILLIYGFLLFIFGWMILIGISFYMIDVIFRLAFGAVLLPFGIATAISPRTVAYTKNIWNIFLNAFFSFMLLGIIMGVSMHLVDLALGRSESAASSGELGHNGSLNMFLSDIDAQIAANEVHEIAKELIEFGSLVLTIICFCVVVQLVSKMGDLASKISGTSGLTDAAKQAVAPLAQKAIAKAKETAKDTGAAAEKTALHFGKYITRKTRADKLYKWTNKRLKSAQGFLTGTGSEGYKAWWRR